MASFSSPISSSSYMTNLSSLSGGTITKGCSSKMIVFRNQISCRSVSTIYHFRPRNPVFRLTTYSFVFFCLVRILEFFLFFLVSIEAVC